MYRTIFVGPQTNIGLCVGGGGGGGTQLIISVGIRRINEKRLVYREKNN